MSAHLAFRRQPVPQQVAQKHTATVLAAPTLGLSQSENFAFMKPGSALISDNWVPTMRGQKLRGGFTRWAELPETTPIISAFEYVSGNIKRMFVGNATKLYDVTTSTPFLAKSGQTSGHYSASQLANASGDYLIAVNDAGDFPLRFDGATWTTLNGGQITGPGGTPVELGAKLTHVWKYRNRWFFIEANSMNAWYLPLNAIQGALAQIPLSGAATQGGKLLFGASWSIDAGDGIDDKCVFCTDLGELLIFTGGNPADAANWRQEGRYQIPPPMGKNAYATLGGDLLVATVDGIVPVSAAITKDAAQLDLASITYSIRSMWRNEAVARRTMPWTMKRWDEYGGMFVTWPGGQPGDQRCAVVNTGTLAWTRFTGWDATCFILKGEELFFGTQKGIVMQADRTGTDDGQPYVATLVFGWGALQSQPSTVVWHQARASFTAASSEPFNPQLTSCTDFIINLPQPPTVGVEADSGLGEVWDQGKWDQARWDQDAISKPVVRNTGWVSIGVTGYTHAPVVQVTVAQQLRPTVELISIDATFERLGVNV